MASLAELVDVVIGVDTHKHTHTGAVVATPSGAVLDHDTVGTDPDGYDQLVALADAHSGLRAWAIESTGGYGAGLKRHLEARGEWIIELDRPNRPARPSGAKSDPSTRYAPHGKPSPVNTSPSLGQQGTGPHWRSGSPPAAPQ